MDRFKCKGRPTGHHGFLPPSSGGSGHSQGLCTAVHCASLNWQLWTSVSKISCAVWWLNGREKMGPGILQCPFLQGFTSGPWKLPHYPLFGWFCVQNACQFISCPCALQSKIATKRWIPETACGVDIPLSLSLLSPYSPVLFSAWLFFGKFMANQPTNAKHANLEQKIRFKTSFVSRSPWYPSIYSQGPCNPLKPPPAFRQSLPLGGSGQRKKVPSTSRRKPTKYSLFLADRGCWQWSVMIHLCPKKWSVLIILIIYKWRFLAGKVIESNWSSPMIPRASWTWGRPSLRRQCVRICHNAVKLKGRMWFFSPSQRAMLFISGIYILFRPSV